MSRTPGARITSSPVFAARLARETRAEALDSSSDPTSWIAWLIDHARALRELDRAMVRLPGLVYMAVGADAPQVSSLSIAVSLIAAFAEPRVELPADGQLGRIILAVSSAITTETEGDPTSEEGRAA